MNYAQNYDFFFPFFIKVVVNKSKAYSFLIIGIMHLQKILLSDIMLRFYFFTAKQGTWVLNFDRGPLSPATDQLFAVIAECVECLQTFKWPRSPTAADDILRKLERQQLTALCKSSTCIVIRNKIKENENLYSDERGTDYCMPGFPTPLAHDEQLRVIPPPPY